MTQRPRLIPGLFVVLAVLVSCQSAQATPKASATASPSAASQGLKEGVTLIPFGDDQQLPITVHGHGATLVILANMGSGGMSQWDPLVSVIDQERFTILTFAYMPDSVSSDEYYMATVDSDAIYAYASAAGIARMICIGASLGVTACGELANKPEIVGEILISGPNHSPFGFSGAFPKLFVAGSDDPWAESASSEYAGAAEPKKLVLYEGNSAHGTDLFASTDGSAFLALLKGFVDDIG